MLGIRMTFAPIALFVYNRPEHMRKTLTALQGNLLAKDTPLFVFCDAAKNQEHLHSVHEVRQYAHSITGFKSVTVIERDKNFGLAMSIIDGVTRLCHEFGQVIVVEDDLLTSPDFLSYMNQGLELYRDDNRVASIHGYAYPLEKGNIPSSYFLRGADCWGWATWSRAWENFEPDGKKLLTMLQEQKLESQFDFDGQASFVAMLKDQIAGKNQSWAVRWHASAFLKNMLTLYPCNSLVINFGFDNSGTHCGTSDIYKTEIGEIEPVLKKVKVEENMMMRNRMVSYYKQIRIVRHRTFFLRANSYAIRRFQHIMRRLKTKLIG